MPAYSNAVAIGDAHVDDLVDSGLCARDELIDVTVVRLLSVGADDRHCRPVEHAVAVHEQHQVVLTARPLELVRRSGELRGGISGLELARIRPEKKGKPSL